MKKSVSLILAIMMLIGIFSSLPITAGAEESVTAVSNWSQLKTALENGTSGTIKISKGFSASLTTNDRVIITTGSKVLNLNDQDPLNITASGDVAFCNLITITGGSLTIKGCSRIRYTYNISQDYSSSEKPSALCYVNGGTLKTTNCELICNSGSAVKVNAGTASIGIGSNLSSQGSWAVTDGETGNGTINISSKAYLYSYNHTGYSSQGEFDGVGALGVHSSNTALNVSSGMFGGGVQVKTAAQAQQFSPKSKQISCDGVAALNYELRTNKTQASNAGEKYYWYTYNGMYYYFGTSDSSNNNHPDTIYVNYNKEQNYNIEVYDCDKAMVYAGYGKSTRGVLTADKDDEVIIRSYSSKNFDKWVILSGNAVIEDITKSVTILKVGASDVSVMPTFKDTSIKSVEVTGVVAPKTGAKVNTYANIPAGVEYELPNGQDNAASWWHQDTMITYPDAYAAGTAYEVRVMLRVTDNSNSFSQNVTAKINGVTAQVINNQGSYIVISREFPMTEGSTPVTPDTSDFTYTKSGSNVTITGYTGSNPYVEIPSTIDGCKVTSIANAFMNNSTLVSVTIPDGVTSLGNSAFYSCTSLTHVTIPYSLKSIGSNAFAGCTALESIIIPSNVETIATYAFDGCTNLVEVILNEGLETIGVCSFYNCGSLTYVCIPDTVKTIGLYAFGYYDANGSSKPIEGFTIEGSVNTEAENYANSNGFTFNAWSDWQLYSAATPDENGQEYRYRLNNPSIQEYRPIAQIAKVKLSTEKFTYNGKTRKPTVTVTDANGRKLVSGTDYKIIYPSNPVKCGLYVLSVSFKGNYGGLYDAQYSITQAKNPMTVKAVSKSVKYSTVKKKNASVTTLSVKKAQGTKTFKKLSGNKKITVNTKTGKLTVKKGLKKGTYTLKVKITAKGNKNYKSLSKTVSFKVKVK